MKRVTKLVSIGMAVLAIVLGVAISESLAATFTLWGINDPNLRADVVFVYTPGTGKIEISVTNTSLPAAGLGSRFTGFAFNVPDDVTGISSFIRPIGWRGLGWSGLYDTDDINAPMQSGYFDMAGLTGPTFGGGKPFFGIPRGFTYNFSFFLTGTNLDLLTEDSFLGLLSYDPPNGPTENVQPFVGHFQRTGINRRGSDVAVFPAPVPATFLLFGSGLLGLVGLARRLKR